MTSVSPCERNVCRADEVAAQLLEVVDLAVQGHDDRAVLVRQRLVRGLAQVDDREATVDEGDGRRGRVIGERPGRIRPAMGEGGRHRTRALGAGRSPGEREDSCQTAHLRSAHRPRPVAMTGRGTGRPRRSRACLRTA